MGQDVVEIGTKTNHRDLHKATQSTQRTFTHAQMFSPEAPPLPWDAAGEYSRPRVELYYLAHAGTPLTPAQLEQAMAGRWPEGVDSATESEERGPKRFGPAAAKWVRVTEAKSLRQVLTEAGHVVAGVPLFFVVAGGSEYAARFLAER